MVAKRVRVRQRVSLQSIQTENAWVLMFVSNIAFELKKQKKRKKKNTIRDCVWEQEKNRKGKKVVDRDRDREIVIKRERKRERERERE